jgi:DNA-binding NtrC family response regulator
MVENARIAVIDDEQTVLESFNLVLQIKNYNITLFERATDFFEKFETGKYDVIFLDLFLKKDPPPYNRDSKDGGIEALKKIKELDPKVQVVVVTGYATERTHVNAITYGAMEYLNKPFVMEDIYELVNRALRKIRDLQSKGKGDKENGGVGSIH